MNIEGFNISKSQINQSTAKKLLGANLSLQYSYYYEYSYFKDCITVYRKNKDGTYSKVYVLSELNFNQYYNLCSFLESHHIRQYNPNYSSITKLDPFDTEEEETQELQKAPLSYYILFLFLLAIILYFI